jgi:hypothetical protein
LNNLLNFPAYACFIETILRLAEKYIHNRPKANRRFFFLNGSNVMNENKKIVRIAGQTN